MLVKAKKRIKTLKNKHKSIRKSASIRKKHLPTISLCMIVRDAAERLSLCLDSVKNVADEIIIVDTGSVDNTVAIAKKYTDNIYFYKWRGDFAKVRNESLKYATKDWVLILDDDEVLSLDSVKKIKKFLSAAPKHEDVYAVWIYNCVKEDAEKEIWQKQRYKGLAVHRHNRILRNHCKLKFTHSLHEMITGRDGAIYSSHIHILHYGYSGNMREKLQRNLAIAKEQLLRKPNDYTCRYNYTRSLSSAGKGTELEILANIDKTIALYIEANKNKKKRTSGVSLQLIYHDFIEILIFQKLYTQAEKYCYAWLTKLCDNWDLTPYVLLGKIMFLAEKYNEAYRMLDLVYKKSRNGVPFCPEEKKAQIYADLYYFLGSVYIIQGEYKKGLRLMRLVKRDYFNNASVDKLIEIANAQLKTAPES